MTTTKGTTMTTQPVTAERVTEWAHQYRERTIHELKYLIQFLQDDLAKLEAGKFVGDEHALRYRQYCEELHGMKLLARVTNYAPSEAAQ